ncbi:MAG TPA: hypothetical protein VLV89_10645 [Candidatus Acidoferrum sp.]|nr:hypothetical protein [Candidatus Acidoferrum sp.]
MNLFDLLFIALFLSAIVSLAAAGIAAARGKRASALRTLRILGVCAAVYFAIVFIVSAATPRKMLNPGDPQCFDDWCISAEGAQRVNENSEISYDVTLRISSRAKRISQRENNVVVYLTDDNWRRFDSIPQNSDVPINTLLGPGESVIAHRIFRLPADARGVGAVVTHKDGFLANFPGCLVITENDWFHKPVVTRLD